MSADAKVRLGMSADARVRLGVSMDAKVWLGISKDTYVQLGMSAEAKVRLGMSTSLCLNRIILCYPKIAKVVHCLVHKSTNMGKSKGDFFTNRSVSLFKLTLYIHASLNTHTIILS